MSSVALDKVPAGLYTCSRHPCNRHPLPLQWAMVLLASILLCCPCLRGMLQGFLHPGAPQRTAALPSLFDACSWSLRP